MTQDLVRLFSYGTLRLPAVQLGTFGRLVEGAPDALAGYRLEPLAISDPAVVALSGAAVHRIARRTGNPADRIEGVVFTITEAELEATDRYEVDVYGRIEERLESGIAAFVYVGPPLDPEAI
jgi:hypothetical protein